MAKQQSTPNKRRGLRKLECVCGAFVYTTWAQAERFGMPACGCGERFEPTDVELGYALGLDTPDVQAYAERVARRVKAQQGHDHRGHALRDKFAETAADWEADRRERARRNRLNALRPVVAEPIPF